MSKRPFEEIFTHPDDDNLVGNKLSAPRNSTQRYRRGGIPGVAMMAQNIVDDMGEAYTPRATRAQLQRQTTRQMTTQHGRRALQKAPNIQAPVSSSCRNSRRSKQPKHPLFYIGGTAGGLLGGYILLTYLVGWCVTHLSDPGSFGPTHGNIVVGVFGGGDSQVKPSKLIALNNNGHVQLMKITSNDPAKTQILVGPDLGRLEFPDPAGAEIQMEVGDYDHDGHTDVKVSILGTTFTSPFTRYRSQYVLYGDGKGGLKQRPQ